MSAEDLLLPISGLQHWVFCPRQCGLIHLERLWAENRFTAQGRTLHDRAHDGPDEARPGLRITRGLAIRSLRLGLAGVADVVEFASAEQTVAKAHSIRVPGWHGRWVPRPVEYKRGRPKSHDADRVQLCAQGLCLEEMLHTNIPVGLLFYGRTRRRQEVYLNEELRQRTTDVTGAFRAMLDSGQLPPPRPGPKCKACSLRSHCLPKSAATGRASRYLARNIRNALNNDTFGES